MKTVHKTFAKALAGTVAAGAMAVGALAPAQARDFDGPRVSVTVASPAAYGYERSGYGDRYYGDWNRGDWNRGGWNSTNPRQAINQCVVAAERVANRSSWGGRSDVTDIRSVRNTRYGLEVRGRIAVNTMGRGWRYGDGNYGRGWGGDYRGWNNGMRGYDAGSFTCTVSRGRVVDLDFDGIRGL